MTGLCEQPRRFQPEDWASSDSGALPFPQDAASEAYGASLDPGRRRTAIARLRDSEIERMERLELVKLIRATDDREDRHESHLEHQSLDQLKRLAYLSRRCCNNQVNTYCAWRRVPLRYKAAI